MAARMMFQRNQPPTERTIATAAMIDLYRCSMIWSLIAMRMTQAVKVMLPRGKRVFSLEKMASP